MRGHQGGSRRAGEPKTHLRYVRLCSIQLSNGRVFRWGFGNGAASPAVTKSIAPLRLRRPTVNRDPPYLHADLPASGGRQESRMISFVGNTKHR